VGELTPEIYPNNVLKSGLKTNQQIRKQEYFNTFNLLNVRNDNCIITMLMCITSGDEGGGTNVRVSGKTFKGC
jgi:hypothetical protein